MSPAGSASASDLTIEQYAGIPAAIAEGYPLDAVLAPTFAARPDLMALPIPITSDFGLLDIPRAAPPLTLEQHASLAVELTTSPETLARYRLGPEARAELDAHYREKKASSAETRAAWDRAYHSYFNWLAANRRSAR